MEAVGATKGTDGTAAIITTTHGTNKDRIGIIGITITEIGGIRIATLGEIIIKTDTEDRDLTIITMIWEWVLEWGGI